MLLIHPGCACGVDNEDTNHYLLHCPLFAHERNIIVMELRDIGLTVINEDVLTNGLNDRDLMFNTIIFSIIHAFIEETDRL